jgi:hypothetical protein
MNRKQLLPVLFLMMSPVIIFSQANESYKTVVAGKQYDRSASFQKKWGVHYRNEWKTPVSVKIVMLDTLAGGLVPYAKGGGRQTNTLRLRDKQGREYVLRSIDKSFGKALPEIYQGTFIEDIINDQVSIGHPYAALTINQMAEAAKIYHTVPQIIFIPEQPALDTFNKEFANQLYLFEQRPDENWETAPNFGNSKLIVSTEKMLEELAADNSNRIDQKLFVRSRLFDMLIGDWGRHEDQWRWATIKDGDGKLFQPIPRDRDQAYTLFDGKMLGLALSVGGLDHLQSFDSTIKDITKYNFPARNLDRRAANEVSQDEWVRIATELQLSLTDKVIEAAVRQLPPEVYNLSGEKITRNLKIRRSHLDEYAKEYYLFLSKAVDIPGSDKKEIFSIQRLDDNKTLVRIHDSKKKLLYNRTFFTSETSEIRLYGMGSDDVFTIDGKTNKGILLRVVGGNGEDSLTDLSLVGGRSKLTRVYDSEKSKMESSRETKMFISNDSTLNNYQYETFEYDEKGFTLKPGFFSLTLGYGSKHQKWRKEPVGDMHSLKVKYSISRQAINLTYNSTFYQAVGKWNVSFTAGAGIPSVVNFFGVGNETRFEEYNRPYFRLRSRDYYGKLGLNRYFGNHFVEVNSVYQTVKIFDDDDRFISDFSHGRAAPVDFKRTHFVGGEAKYVFRKANDEIVPTSGFTFTAGAAYTRNLSNSELSFTKLNSEAAVYIPVFSFISFAFRVGGATNIGDAEFYQLNTLGSHDNLRGYRKWRFYGKHAAFSNNDIRLIFNNRNKLFNGKMGLIGFYDVGRVWQPDEESDTWHVGYGGGLFFSPFKKLILSGNMGFSKEDRVMVFHIGFFF